MTKKLLLTICFVLIATSAFSVPNLQIYIPDGTYDTDSDTWVAPSTGTFDVWVIAGNLSETDIIYDIGLVASLSSNADPASGSLSITPSGGSAVSYTNTDFAWGTPPISDPLASHGIYPTWYVDHYVTAQTSTNSADWVDVYDMPTGGGPTNGQIFQFTINSTYNYVHFDAYGYQTNGSGAEQRIFAPFSHDGESGGKTPPPEVPEPATMILFGVGLAGASAYRRFRNKK